MVIFFAGYRLSFLLSRKVAFCENGSHFPQEPSGPRARFIAWPHIERFYWDDDVLTIMPASSLLRGGGRSARVGRIGPDTHSTAATGRDFAGCRAGRAGLKDTQVPSPLIPVSNYRRGGHFLQQLPYLLEPFRTRN
jgi:hypothetical protein